MAVISKHPMAPGDPEIEGSIHGHDVIPVKAALKYFEKCGYPDYVPLYQNIKAVAQPYLHIWLMKEVSANRVMFGKAVKMVLDTLSKEEAAVKVMVIDSDLEGFTGLKFIRQKHPEVFIPSGIMECSNFSTAAGFGFVPDLIDVFSTFSAFFGDEHLGIDIDRIIQCWKQQHQQR